MVPLEFGYELVELNSSILLIFLLKKYIEDLKKYVLKYFKQYNLDLS